MGRGCFDVGGSPQCECDWEICRFLAAVQDVVRLIAGKTTEFVVLGLRGGLLGDVNPSTTSVR